MSNNEIHPIAKLVIGKRYQWSPHCSGLTKWKNGILSEIIHESKGDYGIFVTRNNEEWIIPLSSMNIEEYKKK